MGNARFFHITATMKTCLSFHWVRSIVIMRREPLLNYLQIKALITGNQNLGMAKADKTSAAWRK